MGSGEFLTLVKRMRAEMKNHATEVTKDGGTFLVKCKCGYENIVLVNGRSDAAFEFAYRRALLDGDAHWKLAMEKARKGE